MPLTKRTNRASASHPTNVVGLARKTSKINLNPLKTWLVLKRQNTMSGIITRAAHTARRSQPKTHLKDPHWAMICMKTRSTQIRMAIFASPDGSRKYRSRQSMTGCKLTLEPIRCKLAGCRRRDITATSLRSQRLRISLLFRRKTVAMSILALARLPASPALKRQRRQS